MLFNTTQETILRYTGGINKKSKIEVAMCNEMIQNQHRRRWWRKNSQTTNYHNNNNSNEMKKKIKIQIKFDDYGDKKNWTNRN